MTSFRGTRRSMDAALIMVGRLVIAAIAAGSLRQVGQAVTGSAAPCAPAPCSAPHGFEVDISNLSSANGLVTMQVRFKNHTTGDALEAVSYRHTSRADFKLHAPDGGEVGPLFNGQCPDWGELRIERGRRRPQAALLRWNQHFERLSADLIAGPGIALR
jgi:hypothetical protein